MITFQQWEFLGTRQLTDELLPQLTIEIANNSLLTDEEKNLLISKLDNKDTFFIDSKHMFANLDFALPIIEISKNFNGNFVELRSLNSRYANILANLLEYSHNTLTSY
jgi:hypothetical protein